MILHNLTVEQAIDSLTKLERELIFYLIGKPAAEEERIKYAQRANARGVGHSGS